MKKVTWEATTERMYVQLVQEVPEESDVAAVQGMMGLAEAMPKAYLMIGKPGSTERTRIEGPDAELLLMTLSKVMSFSMGGGVGMRTMGHPPAGPPFGMVPQGA